MDKRNTHSWRTGEDIKRRPEPARPAIAPYHNLPTVLAREAAPTKYRNAGDLPLPLALHHVIPWNILRDFWGEMFRHEHFEAFKEFLSLYGWPKAQLRELPRQVQQGTFSSVNWPRAGMFLDQFICWGQWNLVRGPTHRIGRQEARTLRGYHTGYDPEDDFDDLHWFAGEDTDRLLQLRQLFIGLKEYCGDPAASNEREVIAFLKAFRMATIGAEIVPFRAEMWIVDPNSAEYAPGSRDHGAIHPRWWKRQR